MHVADGLALSSHLAEEDEIEPKQSLHQFR
jgi:hypothetical protein